MCLFVLKMLWKQGRAEITSPLDRWRKEPQRRDSEVLLRPLSNKWWHESKPKPCSARVGVVLSDGGLNMWGQGQQRNSCLLAMDLASNQKDSTVRAARTSQGPSSLLEWQSRNWNTCEAPPRWRTSTPVDHCLSTCTSRKKIKARVGRGCSRTVLLPWVRSPYIFLPPCVATFPAHELKAISSLSLSAS